jgi:hypothetical protein
MLAVGERIWLGTIAASITNVVGRRVELVTTVTGDESACCRSSANRRHQAETGAPTVPPLGRDARPRLD